LSYRGRQYYYKYICNSPKTPTREHSPNNLVSERMCYPEVIIAQESFRVIFTKSGFMYLKLDEYLDKLEVRIRFVKSLWGFYQLIALIQRV